MKRVDVKRIQQLASELFEYEQLRPGQLEAIESVLAGRDTLAVMPTGSGKSAIYQLAALLIDGPTLVISPLIALQRDQVAAIAERPLPAAALVNSTLNTGEREEALAEYASGELEFLFLAPEQFGNEETLEHLRSLKPSLFVVDEAHCVSEWGHDFRPDYLKLGQVIEALGHPAVLALTATAAPPVREEIVSRLGMREASQIVRGFDRPNLWLGVETFQDQAEKQAAFLAAVGRAQKPGIVYAATRRCTEELADALNAQGTPAAAYHAGLSAHERAERQTAFMDDATQVIVATTAFGMGIDKPNVRFVYHYDISGSLDSYYQEIGRAGRDGERAEAVLFYCPQDLGVRRYFAGSGSLTADEIEPVAEWIGESEAPVALEALQSALELSQSKLTHALDRLEEVGAIEVLDDGAIVAAPIDPVEAAEAAARAQEHRRQYERSRLEMMCGYAEVRDCRREYL
ncbi:MAG: ATP-dependent DNA helicase RecQ, partial [Gemmatimonadaceae bacterium]|nr:ATP-dependent DNA helicase RecQ [Gloeobacterales cyanobacterium ES-bin-141]